MRACEKPSHQIYYQHHQTFNQNFSTHTTHIVHPSHIHEQAAIRSSDVTIVKNVPNQQPVIEQHQNQQYTHIQNQQHNYIPNSIQNNSEPSQHLMNQSHIYVNAPNPVNVLQKHHGNQWASESPQQHASGQHNHMNSQVHDHLTQQSPQQMHPGSAGHVPYSPSLGPSNNYQNVEVIRQVQYQQQHHQQFNPHNVQQQRLVPSNQGDRNIQIVGRNKPVGTVAPNTHTTASTVQPRLIEPTDAGIIPPEYRTSFHGQGSIQVTSTMVTQAQSSLQSSNISDSSTSDKKLHQWSTNPVEEWAKEQVCQWLLALGMESYITLFMDRTITGAALLNLDSSGLKDLGIKNKDDREKIKKKIKELKAHNDREKKDMEKEKSKREKLLKRAEKVVKKK